MSVSAIYQDFKNSIETSVQQHSQAMGNLNSLPEVAKLFGFREALVACLKHLEDLISKHDPVNAPVVAPAVDGEILSPAPDVAADAVAQVENVLGGAAEVVHDVQEIVQG